MTTRTINTILATLITLSGFSQSSVFNTGIWYKLGVEKNGVYKITHDQFKKMGFDPGKTDPRKIKIFGLKGGMLPQPNAVSRDNQPVELSIQVKGEEDGIFHKQDYILFYGEGPDGIKFIPQKDVFHYEKNLYSDKNYYFITVGDNEGKRIITDAAGDGGNPVSTFQDFIYYEKDEHNELKSGREWFGERFEVVTEYTFNFDVEGIVNNTPVIFVSDVMAQSVNAATFRVSFNSQLIGEQNVPVTPTSTYGIKGRHKRDTISISSALVSASQQTKQVIKYNYIKGSSGRSTGYLNFFSFHFTRNLALYGNQTLFRNSQSNHLQSQFVISNVGPSDQIWNISDPYDPRMQSFSLVNNNASFTFTSSNDLPGEFIVFNARHPDIEFVGKIENQNLHGLSTPDFVIITHPSFKSEAERLANHRAGHNNWTSAVVTPDQVFNEFSSGRQDVTAIRDFVKHLYDKNPQKLKALLLFGKCSYDFKNRIANNTNFVITYESRNSLSPLETYSSDDYFGFLESDEGEWGENNFLQNHSLDIGVGRLPVKTASEAKAIVDKLIDYDNNSSRFGRWRKDIVFVADDGSNADGFTSIHQSQANVLADNIELQFPEFNTRKLFLGTYSKIVTPNAEAIPQANEDIRKEFNQSVIINYTGHGSEKLWADERVLTQEGIENLDNRNFPFIVTATCEFGRHDNPAEVSSAEMSVLKENAGSIGLVTTARPVNSSTNFSLNAAFYDALFLVENEKRLTLGEVFRRTKNNSTSGVANRNFSLLGDPTMTLALPKRTIVAEEIKTSLGSDTLKALSRVIIKGSILDNDGSIDSDFEGIIHATLFDKKTSFVTIGKNDPAFSFQQWFNPLFRGEASVNKGKFEIKFILPRNIAYEINPGKLSLYAHNSDQSQDATGASSSFKIGGSETGVIADTRSPDLEVFLGDETFIEGGTVSPNSLLVVNTFDESGINISNYGIGNTMMAILDNDSKVYLLNEHYTASVDDFRHGTIRFPLRDLPPGEHSITVKIWDTYNNPAEKTVRFRVSEQGVFALETFGNFPNPFSGETTFFFTHNRPGDDLQARLTILNLSGQELTTFEFELPSSTFQVNLLELEQETVFGKKLSPGLYFGRLRIRSLSDGAGSERVTKLIVSN